MGNYKQNYKDNKGDIREQFNIVPCLDLHHFVQLSQL